MTNVYRNRSGIFKWPVIFLVLIIMMIYSASKATVWSMWIFVFIFLFIVAFWDLGGAFLFAPWAYDENGFVKYSFLFRRKTEFKWSQVENLYCYTSGQYGQISWVLRTYDGTKIRVNAAYDFKKVSAEVARYVRFYNPKAQIDQKWLSEVGLD